MIAHIKTLHQKIITSDESEFQYEPRKRNLYEVFFDWLLESLQYGFLFVFCINAFFGWQGLLNNALFLFAFGFARWLLLDTIKEIASKIKGTG